MGIIEGAQPRPGRVRTLAANVVPVLARDDGVVSLASTDATSRAVTMTATQTGHEVIVVLRQRSSTGAYTLVVASGTITLDAVGEGAIVAYDGSAWHLAALTGGATIA